MLSRLAWLLQCSNSVKASSSSACKCNSRQSHTLSQQGRAALLRKLRYNLRMWHKIVNAKCWRVWPHACPLHCTKSQTGGKTDLFILTASLIVCTVASSLF
ncbi:unnamed protein product [Ixodes pacificus]